MVPHSGAKHVLLLHFFLNQIKHDPEPPLDKGSEKFTTSQVMGCLSACLGDCESVQKMWGEAFGFSSILDGALGPHRLTVPAPVALKRGLPRSY